MVEFIAKVWAWFNGNKLQIGTLCLALVAFEGDLFGLAWLELFLAWAGGVLAPVGLAHKVIKGTNNT